MAWVSLWREGKYPTTGTSLHICVAHCIQYLGLDKRHYHGVVPPKSVGADPHLDNVRGASATVVHLTRQEAPSGWLAGWYMISSTDLSIHEATRVLKQYPEAESDAWEQ